LVLFPFPRCLRPIEPMINHVPNFSSFQTAHRLRTVTDNLPFFDRNRRLSLHNFGSSPFRLAPCSQRCPTLRRYRMAWHMTLDMTAVCSVCTTIPTEPIISDLQSCKIKPKFGMFSSNGAFGPSN
jgi:hypothetical protein